MTAPAPPSLLVRLRDRPYVLECGLLVLLLLALPLLPEGLSVNLISQGVFGSAALLLHVIAVVLVYRSNRFVNFAQIQFGATGAALFVLIVNGDAVIRAIGAVCAACGDDPGRGLEVTQYLLAIVLAFAVSCGLAFSSYHLVIRRFASAPRLVVTVASIFLAQALAGITNSFASNGFLVPPEALEDGLQPGEAPGALVDLSVTIGSVPRDSSELALLALALAAAVLVPWWLSRSATGNAILASSENPRRAATLGLDVDKVNGRVWLLAGALSGLAAVLGSMTAGLPLQADASGGVSGAAVISIDLLVRILAVALIARFVSLVVAAFASFALGLLSAGVIASYESDAYVQASLLLLMGVALLLQRGRRERVDSDSAGAWAASKELRPVPRELRDLPAVRNARAGGIAAVLLFLGIFPWLAQPGAITLAATFIILTMVGLSLLVLTGWAGQISLGHMGLAAVGAYTVAVTGLPILLSLPLAALAGTLAAFLIGLPALRLKGLQLAVMTLAFAVTANVVLLNPDLLGRHLPNTVDRPPLLGVDLENDKVFYYLCLVFVVLTALAVIGMRRSRIARVLIAARDNEAATQSLGVDVLRARLSAFAVSGGIAALAGGLYVYAQHSTTGQDFAPEQSLLVFTVTIIGGLGSVAGPLIGFAYYAFIRLLSESPAIVALSSGMGGLLLLIFAPGGLAALFADARDAMLRRVAKRHRITVPSLYADGGARLATQRTPIEEKTRRDGGTVFVPERYRRDDHWPEDASAFRARLREKRSERV